MENRKTIFKDKDGYFIEQDGNRIYVKPVDSKEKDESKWTFTDGTNTYTPSQLQEKRAEYSSSYDPYALTDLLDWTAENTIGLPIKWAAQTETGQKALPYVGKVLSVIQPSKWYGTLTGKGALWSDSNTGFGNDKHGQSLNTLVDLALAPVLVKGGGAVAKTVGTGAMNTASNAVRFGKSIYYSNNPSSQYLRYIGGKFKFGFDVQLPDLIRRTKDPMPKLHITRHNSRIFVSPLKNRFAFQSSGEANPVITNFTTDLPVIPHSGGNWTGFDINIIKGKQLLGKNVISTKPMDTFTYGDIIKVPKKSITTISSNYGTVPEKVLMDKFYKIYRRPTLNDYKFMDYVFQPKYTSEVIPKIDINDVLKSGLNIDKWDQHPVLKYWNNANMGPRMYQEWAHVMYDIAPTTEYEFRKGLDIDLKKYLNK